MERRFETLVPQVASRHLPEDPPTPDAQGPVFPIPKEWRSEIRLKNGAVEEIIKPEKVGSSYGINFIYLEPKETKSGVFELVETSGLDIFIRTQNPQLFKEYFGFLWKKSPPASVDIIIVKKSYLCLQDSDREGSAFSEDNAKWVYRKFETFIRKLKENKEILRQTGLPNISLPNGESVSENFKEDLTMTPYINFGGYDIERTIYHLTKLQETYDWGSLVCTKGFYTAGRAAGPMPEFVLDRKGNLVFDTNGKPLVRLHGRIYCAINLENIHNILDTGELVIHELSHEEVMFKELPATQPGQPGEHIKEGANLFTRKSFEYYTNAQAFDSQKLFVFRTENADEVAITNPAGLLLGMAALGGSKFFAERKTKPYDRATFLSTILGSFALMNLGVFNSKEQKTEFFSLF